VIEQDEQIASKFRRLVELRTERDETKATADRAEEEYREYESELFDEMEASPVKGARRIDLGEPFGLVVFTPRETKFGRILNLDDALDYFETRAMSDEMTKPGISKRKLNELVRELLEQGKPMPAGVDWYANRGITISKKG
jgi:hypothetical protein